MLGVADGGVVVAVNNPDASQIIICRQIAQFHWEHQHDLWPKSHSHLATQIQTDTKYKYNNQNLISRPITQSSFRALAWFEAAAGLYNRSTSPPPQWNLKQNSRNSFQQSRNSKLEDAISMKLKKIRFQPVQFARDGTFGTYHGGRHGDHGGRRCIWETPWFLDIGGTNLGHCWWDQASTAWDWDSDTPISSHVTVKLLCVTKAQNHKKWPS